MKTVVVFGTFDIIHLGHIAFFKEAKKHGDYLVVIVARDSRVRGIKGHHPVFSEHDRVEMLQELSIIDKVILGDKSNVYKAIKNIKPDVIVLGYDQEIFTDKLAEKIKEFGLTTEIIRSKARKPQLYKSKLIRGKISEKPESKHLVVPLGIIVREGKILLNKRNDLERPHLHGKWEFPGGGMEIGETIEENLLREVKEECGYDVEIVSPLKKIWTINHKNSSMVHEHLNIYLIPFVCRIVGGGGKIQDAEVLETNWVLPEEVENYDLILENKKLYQSFFSELVSIIKTNNL